MARYSPDWLAQYMSRFSPVRDSEDIPDAGPESELAGKITKHAKEHGWVGQCFRQSIKARGFLEPGLPD